MNEFFRQLQSPAWWVTVVIVGLGVNLISAYLKAPIDVVLSKTSSRWRVRSEVARGTERRWVDAMVVDDAFRSGVAHLAHTYLVKGVGALVSAVLILAGVSAKFTWQAGGPLPFETWAYPDRYFRWVLTLILALVPGLGVYAFLRFRKAHEYERLFLLACDRLRENRLKAVAAEVLAGVALNASGSTEGMAVGEHACSAAPVEQEHAVARPSAADGESTSGS